MTHEQDERRRSDVGPPDRVPAFNVPGVVLASILVLAIIHFVTTRLLAQADDLWVILNFAFIPGCYGELSDLCEARETAAGLWSPVSHAFLHGDWTHLLINALWLLAFGTPVARRIGARRFLAFALIGSLAGAALFYAMNRDLLQPMIGASGVVSALMGGACRFALGSPAGPTRPGSAHAPLLGVRASLANRTIVFFVAIFFLTNLALGSGVTDYFGLEGGIAWEAHIGGFLFGFLAFGAFDRRIASDGDDLRPGWR